MYVYFEMPEPAYGIQLVYNDTEYPELVTAVRDGDAEWEYGRARQPHAEQRFATGYRGGRVGAAVKPAEVRKA